jgi:HEPN domain-containing protein
MNKNKRKMIEGWINKASNQLQVAREHSKSSYRCSEVIEAAQECIELSVKAVLAILNVKFPPSHEWKPDKKEFAAIAGQIQERQLLHKLEEHDLHLSSVYRDFCF